MNLRKIAAALGAIVLAGTLAACGSGSSSGSDSAKTLKVGIKFDQPGIGFKNADVDKLIAQQRVTVDAKERGRLLGELQKKAYDDVPTVTLYYEDQVWATRSSVHDGVR